MRSSKVFALCALTSLACVSTLQVNDAGRIEGVEAKPETVTTVTQKAVGAMFDKLHKLYKRHGLTITHKGHQPGILLPKSFGGTGGGMMMSDMELGMTLSKRVAPKRIFIIGNAFGLSTLFFAKVFPNADIDVIDAENEGKGNVNGTLLTRAIVKEEGMRVQVTVGVSPADTPKAMRGKEGEYDLVLVDGWHDDPAMIADYNGIRPYLSENGIVLFHDVDLAKMHKAVQTVLETTPNSRYLRPDGIHYKNNFGTGILIHNAEWGLLSDMGLEVNRTK